MAALSEADIQAIIHKKYEKNNSTPSSTSEDYLVRRSLINDAIEKWGGAADAENIRWRELYTTASINLTTATTYNLPADFIAFSSFLKVTSTGDDYYPFKDPDEVMNILADDTTSKFIYPTGYPGSYVLNINPAPTVTGWTSSYSYYKMPAIMDAPNDVPEMSKPYFIVYDVLATLFEEERPDLSNKYLQMAADLMKAMLIENELSPSLHSTELVTLDNKAFGSP